MATTEQIRVAFHECLHRALELVTENFTGYGDDMEKIFLRDGKIEVGMPLSIAFDKSGKTIEVEVDIQYIRDRVKDGGAKIVTPGQATLPGIDVKGDTDKVQPARKKVGS